jgi:DNA-binding transcriptional LysR family regulator
MNDNITVRQLRAFVMVAHERSFTKAAARLNVTQSALTTSIKVLEGELGLRLFDRTTRVVEPTVYGERFAAVAERILEDMGGALDDLRSHAERQHGLVVIAATATVINYLMVPALSHLSEQYPGIRVRLIEELTDGAIKRLRSAEIDLALTTLERSETDVDAMPILRDRFELVCSPHHPLAKARTPLKWSVFSQQESVGLSWQSGIRSLLDRHHLGQKAVRDMRYEVSSVAGLKSMVENNLGIAAVPGLMASDMVQSGIVRRSLTPAIWRTVSLAMRPGRSPTPAASAVIAAALRRLNAIGGQNIVPSADVSDFEARGFDLA